MSAIDTTDRFLVQQVFKPLANEYRISVPADDSSDEGEPLLFVKQKRMKIKEDIRFRRAPDAGAHEFMIKSKSVFEFRGRHEVLDAGGAVIGMLEKVFGKSLLRSHWYVRDAAGEVLFEAHESSWLIALVRRFADLFGDIASLLQWLPFNFTFKRGQQVAGSYQRVLGKLRDRYVLELDPAAMQGVDRRLVVAFPVALAAPQERFASSLGTPSPGLNPSAG